MAPPSPRRPGFSRRAQYGIFATYVIAMFGGLLALLLALTARFDPRGHAALQSVLTDVTTPVANAGRTVMSWFGDAGESVSAYANAASKNKAMEAELKVARQKIIQGQIDARENAELKRLLALKDQPPSPVAVARLVGSTGTIARRYATLAVGSTSGVASGMVVRSANGLIGTIESVGGFSARVRLIIDSERAVPVRRASDGMPAQATGRGDGMIDVAPLVGGNNPFRPGDSFVTSGTGGLYAPGIPVAKVVNVSDGVSTAVPLADPASFDFALVLPPYVAPPPERLPETAAPPLAAPTPVAKNGIQ
jgi:rod shape-determining protein MreC